MTARAQHPGHFAQGLGQQGQWRVVQRLQHQCLIETRIGKRDRLCASGDERQARLWSGQVLGVLAYVDLQRCHAAVRMACEQGT